MESYYGHGALLSDERGFTIYGDCFGLDRRVYEKRAILKQKWGELKEEEEDELDDEDLLDDEDISDYEEDDLGDEEEPDQSGM